jgi:hypothetical protein
LNKKIIYTKIIKIKLNNCLLKIFSRQFVFVLILINIPFTTNSQLVKDHTVRLNSVWLTTGDNSSNKYDIKLLWYNDSNAIDYKIYRKLLNENEFKVISNSIGNINYYFDSTAQKNVEYEYKVEKIGNYADTANYIVSGYIACKYEDFTNEINDTKLQEALNSKHNKGNLLILVDNLIYPKIIDKLLEYTQIMKLDGWNVIIKKAPRTEKFNAKNVRITKNIILNTINSEKITLDNILLFGRIAVPYSGNFAIDGHRDHFGAWHFDGFYGDTIDFYKDSIRYNLEATDSRQHNIINDGKFDNTRITNKISIGVGRVDFYNLPIFKESEIELYNRYIEKNIKFRKGEFFGNETNIFIENAIIDDGFGNNWKSKFAASGFNSFTPLVDWYLLNKELKNDTVVKYMNENRMREGVRNNDYYFAYGCNSGSYNSSYDVAYSEEYASTPVRTIFQTVFGSYNGDFDSEDNLMRSTIASKPSNIISYWGSRPFWNLQSLSLGKTWGYATTVTQNNFDLYNHQVADGNNMVHISLIGDPSLELFTTLPPKNLKIEKQNNIDLLTWEKPILDINNKKNLIGFNIYKIKKSEFLDLNSKLELINDEIIKNQEYILPLDIDLTENLIIIKAVYFIITPSSAFYKFSIGQIAQ